MQITESVPPEVMFADYPYFSSVISSLVAHAGAIARLDRALAAGDADPRVGLYRDALLLSVGRVDEAREAISEAQRILEEARANGAAISKKVNGEHVIDRDPFDPDAEEYQIVAPIAGG